jgi:hypothetical protein
MRRIIYAGVIILAAVYSIPSPADQFTLLHQERIGDLRIGLSENELNNTIKCPLKLGPEQLWGADGAHHQQWNYAGCGIALGMVSKKNGATKSIESIAVTSPSTLTTKQGIGIGSTAQEVMNAYNHHWNNEESNSERFVAGSIYGGLIFNFKNGRVIRIFLGAAAE